MYRCLLLLLSFAVSCHAASDLCVNTNMLKRHMVTAFNYARSYLQQSNKDQTFNYITNIFNNLASQGNGIADNHTFIKYYDGEIHPGSNAILIVKGSRWGTDADRVSLLGTHYDSVRNSPGVDDNGSAMAALLEVARAVTASTCTQLNSVIFVAFDWEEYLLSGSEAFVYNHLIPKILVKNNIPANQFEGAYILDSILNFDDEPNTQTFPDGFGLLFPRAIAEVKAHNYAGDFIASIGRRDDQALMALLQKHWVSEADNKTDKYRAIDINIPFSGRPSESILFDVIRDLFRSDHYHFWDYEGSYTDVGLKAVFLSDTTEFRGYMKQCYHQPCDNENHITATRLQFMAVITNALTNSLLDMATEGGPCKC